MNLLLLLLAMAVSYAAAYNRSRPPALLLASLLLALVVVSVALPWLMLTHLSLRRRVPQQAQVGEELELEVDVMNEGYLPRMMVEVEDVWRYSHTKGDVPAAANHEEDSVRVGLGVLPWVGSCSRRTFKATLPCTRRGVWSLGPARLVCAYPLGLVQRSRSESKPAQDLLVYPRMFEVRQLPLAGSALEANRDVLPLRLPNGADEFLGVREYRHGDPMKRIHWQATARHGELMVRELEPTAAARLCIALDLNAASDVGVGHATTTEAAISIAASVCRWAARTGLPLRVMATQQEEPAPEVRDGLLAGPENTDPLLTWFAALSTRWSMPYADVLSEVEASTHDGETVLAFFSADDQQRARTLAALVSLQDAGAQVLVVVLDRESFQSGDVSVSEDGSDAARRLREELEAWGMHAVLVARDTDLEALFR